MSRKRLHVVGARILLAVSPVQYQRLMTCAPSEGRRSCSVVSAVLRGDAEARGIILFTIVGMDDTGRRP
jgi:hypothetical protein